MFSSSSSGGSPLYSLLLLGGLAWGAVYWFRESKKDGRVALVYFGGLVGAFAGAKLAFMLAEGWLHFHDPNRWLIWLSGKSVMGALPGGWVGVEVAKMALAYRETTGDRFALLLPPALILGRIGCLSAGCCQGVVCSFGTWPAVPVEIGFQLGGLAGLLWLRRTHRQPGQHFHLYLIAYGLFRFGHEFLRVTPKPLAGFSGYQLIALGTAVAAAIAWSHRRHQAAVNNPSNWSADL
jgi:phosphatidylglycerol:prolipoprotein diacylglycerol transferase